MNLFIVLIFAFAGLFTLLLMYVALVWLPNEMHEAYRGAFQALAAAVEERQPVMAGHAMRVADLSVSVATRLGLRTKEIRVVEYAALLHDIGKVSIPYPILNSTEALTAEQEEKLREHAEEGASMLDQATTLDQVTRLVLHHHHRYDELLDSRALPSSRDLLQSQIIAVANTMDSLMHGLSGHEKMSFTRAVGALWQGSGTAYHPQVVDVITKLVMEKGEEERDPAPVELAA